MQYLDMVYKEAMRHFSIAAMIQRTVEEDITICDGMIRSFLFESLFTWMLLFSLISYNHLCLYSIILQHVEQKWSNIPTNEVWRNIVE